MSDLDRARSLLEAAARFDPRRRPPVLALVKFKDRMGRKYEFIVHARDRRQIRELRWLLKHVNQRVTMTRLESISVETAKAMAWMELAHLAPSDVRALLGHPEALDAIAELQRGDG